MEKAIGLDRFVPRDDAKRQKQHYASQRKNRLFLQRMRKRVAEMVREMPCLWCVELMRGRDRRHEEGRQIGEEKRRIGDGQRSAHAHQRNRQRQGTAYHSPL